MTVPTTSFHPVSRCLLLVFSSLMIIQGPMALAQDLSSVYIDSKATAEKYVPGDEATLGSIENVLQRDLPLEQQVKLLGTVLQPIFQDPEVTGILQDLYRQLPEDVRDLDKRDDRALFDQDNRPNDYIALSRLLGEFERDGLGEEEAEALPDAFKGIGGFSTFAAIRYGKCLQLAMEVLASPSGELVPRELCDVPRLGKITEYEFLPASDPGTANSPEGQAKFVVSDMKVDGYRVSYDAAAGALHFTLVQQWSYIWHVRIDDPGFDEFTRMNQIDFELARVTNPAIDPFKLSLLRSNGAIAHANLPAGAKDGMRGDSIWGRGLDHRLFAFGKSIVIEKILATRFKMLPLDTRTRGEGTYSDIYGQQFIRGQILDGEYILPKHHPYRQVSAESCVDIMFRGGFPASRDEFPDDQTGWCLGRCMHPVIENSR